MAIVRAIPRLTIDGRVESSKDFEYWMRRIRDLWGTLTTQINAVLGVTSPLNKTTVGSVVTIGLTEAAASANATASAVSVAGVAGGAYGANEQTIINNHTAAINQLTTDLNAAISSLNDLKTKLRTANILST